MYGHYQNAYKKAAVNTMDQTKLIVMLYDGAIRNLKVGIESMRAGDVEKSHKALVKGKSIISELMGSLNVEKGGDIAQNLRTLYSYMFNQLIDANVRKDPLPAANVLKLLLQLREAWVTVGRKTPAQPSQQPAAGGMGNEMKRVNLKG